MSPGVPVPVMTGVAVLLAEPPVARAGVDVAVGMDVSTVSARVAERADVVPAGSV